MAKGDSKVKIVEKGGFGGMYFLSFIGALVYFVQNSEGFGGFLLAILKAAVWPAFVMHRALELLSL